MAVGLILRFPEVGTDSYDATMKELGFGYGDMGSGWPEKLISHAAGVTPDGNFTVVDLWESREDFDRFVADQLGPAMEKAGEMPQPDVTAFEIHNTYHHGYKGA